MTFVGSSAFSFPLSVPHSLPTSCSWSSFPVFLSLFLGNYPILYRKHRDLFISNLKPSSGPSMCIACWTLTTAYITRKSSSSSQSLRYRFSNIPMSINGNSAPPLSFVYLFGRDWNKSNTLSNDSLTSVSLHLQLSHFLQITSYLILLSLVKWIAVVGPLSLLSLLPQILLAQDWLPR